MKFLSPRSAVLCVLLLQACGNSSSEQRLDDYGQRLARPLAADFAAPAAEASLLPPRSAALQLPTRGGSLGGMDFLRLRGCALQRSIARRNSSLGRVAPPSQRLLLELEFLREAPACIEYLRREGKVELAQLLEDNRGLKTRQLPRFIFNATLGTQEYREFWRVRHQRVDYPANTGVAVLGALARVTASAHRWLRGDYAADEQAFELALADIAAGDGGELLAALRIQATYLEAADALIDGRLRQGPLCPAGLLPSAAPILRTVVKKYFIGNVQPWSAALNDRYHELMKPVRGLESLLSDTLPPAYRSWQEQRDQGLAAGQAAPATHVRRLQKLLGGCYPEFRRDDEATSPSR